MDITGVNSTYIAIVAPVGASALALTQNLYAGCEQDVVRFNFNKPVSPNGTEVFAIVAIRAIA